MRFLVPQYDTSLHLMLSLAGHQSPLLRQLRHVALGETDQHLHDAGPLLGVVRQRPVSEEQGACVAVEGVVEQVLRVAEEEGIAINEENLLERRSQQGKGLHGVADDAWVQIESSHVNQLDILKHLDPLLERGAEVLVSVVKELDRKTAAQPPDELDVNKSILEVVVATGHDDASAGIAAVQLDRRSKAHPHQERIQRVLQLLGRRLRLFKGALAHKPSELAFVAACKAPDVFEVVCIQMDVL